MAWTPEGMAPELKTQSHRGKADVREVRSVAVHAPRPSQGSTLQAALRRGLEATAEALEIMATQGSDWVEGKETVLGGGGGSAGIRGMQNAVSIIPKGRKGRGSC